MIILIDNYDSFVYNIYQYILEFDSDIRCFRNDEISLDEIRALNPTHIVLSPGPGHPSESGVCLEILKSDLNVPIFGVCLGMQAAALAFGGEISRLEVPLHGKSDEIEVSQSGVIFDGLPAKFNVMRYHSLHISRLPECFEILAKSPLDDTIMAIRHKDKPIFAVQFHPESYFSEYGKKIIENFINFKKQEQKTENEPTNFAHFMIKLQNNFPLDSDDFSVICKALNDKTYDIVQLAALLVLISEKSLYPKSLAALVRNILKYSITYNDKSPIFDIVGTGGDRLKTINVSTTSAFILASLGVKVAKHGNKAITSKSGSSDVLSYLNVPLKSSIKEQRELLQNSGLSFFHAPLFHKLVGEVREVRNRLKIGSVFNILGPLLNPNLGLQTQLVGNYLKDVNELIAKTLLELGRKHAIVAHGLDGMDEITICDETLIHEVKNGEIFEYKITPEQFGFKRALHSDIVGGDASENGEILKATLKGEIKDARRDIVVLNSMFGLYVAGFAKSPLEAKSVIENAIDSGKAYDFFLKYTGNLGEN